MADVLFYHLTESRLEDALPSLLEKSVDRGWKVAVHLASEERRDALDAHLWTFREDSFLPHDVDRDGAGAARQPVLLTLAQVAANGASVRFVVDGAETPQLDGCDRLIFMFDGHDQIQVDQARTQWKALKAGGHTLTYWQQTQDRRWEKRT